MPLRLVKWKFSCIIHGSRSHDTTCDAELKLHTKQFLLVVAEDKMTIYGYPQLASLKVAHTVQLMMCVCYVFAFAVKRNTPDPIH